MASKVQNEKKKKKLIMSQIDAGQTTRLVRDVIKSDKILKQDAHDRTAELLKPTIDVQKAVKKSIDDNQNKMIEQLQKNNKR